MAQFLLILVVALVAAALVFGFFSLVSTGGDPGLSVVEPDGRAVPLPADRALTEPDVSALRFDLAVRGYRMGQVDQALRRLRYDLGYKEELIKVFELEVAALYAGDLAEAEKWRAARAAAAGGATVPAPEITGQPPAPGQPALTGEPPVDDVPQAAVFDSGPGSFTVPHVGEAGSSDAERAGSSPR